MGKMIKWKRLSTTKRILYGTLIVSGVFLAIIILAWVIFDRTDAAGIAGVVCAPAAVVIGFYEWKAKAENLAKYGQQDRITMNDREDYTE